MASPSSSHLVALIQEVLRASPDAGRLWNQTAEEIQLASGLGTGEKEVVLSDTEKYLHFCMGTLEYAVSPHARSPMFAKSFGIANRGRAWGWIADQITKIVMDANWTQAPNLS